jgi:hypothetical protein
MLIFLIFFGICESFLHYEKEVSDYHFAFGAFRLHQKSSVHNVLSHCMNEHESHVLNTMARAKANLGERLSSIQNSALYRPVDFELSHLLNRCTAGIEDGDKEILYQYALMLWPRNIYAAKNLAYIYELHGFMTAARDLYIDVSVSSKIYLSLSSFHCM